jgi:hypothetical protein
MTSDFLTRDVNFRHFYHFCLIFSTSWMNVIKGSKHSCLVALGSMLGSFMCLSCRTTIFRETTSCLLWRALYRPVGRGSSSHFIPILCNCIQRYIRVCMYVCMYGTLGRFMDWGLSHTAHHKKSLNSNSVDGKGI